MDRKGVSPVVANLLMVLLVIVLVGVFWAVIKGLMSDSQDDISSGLSKIALDINEKSIEIEYRVVDGVSRNILHLKVRREAGAGDLSKIKFIISDGVKESSSEIDAAGLKEFSENEFSIQINDISYIETISVAPILWTGSKDKTGMIIDTTYPIGYEKYSYKCEGIDKITEGGFYVEGQHFCAHGIALESQAVRNCRLAGKNFESFEVSQPCKTEGKIYHKCEGPKEDENNGIDAGLTTKAQTKIGNFVLEDTCLSGKLVQYWCNDDDLADYNNQIDCSPLGYTKCLGGKCVSA